MAINKSFVIKNGLEVNENLLVAAESNGRVGVGTTVPTDAFHVVGGIAATDARITGIATIASLKVLGITTFSEVVIGIEGDEPTGTVDQKLAIYSGAYIEGNTGIGRTLPNARLDVVPPSDKSAGIFSGSTSEDMVLIVQKGDGDSLRIESTPAGINTSVFVVTGVGTVGVGTTNPDVLLTVFSPVATGTTAIYARGDVVGSGVGSFVSLRSHTAVVSIGTITELTGRSVNFSGINTFGYTTADGANVSGFSTLGSAKLYNTYLAGINTGLNAPGISTLGYVESTDIVVSGFSTLGSVELSNTTLAGINTGLNAPGISTLGYVESTDIVVSGFSSLGSVELSHTILAGINTGLYAPGISTLTSLEGESLNYNGISTVSYVEATDINVSGFSTLGDSSITALEVSGISTLTGGVEASQGILAQGLKVSGISTLTGGVEASQGIKAARLNVTGFQH
jgi:hypothetical protein